MFNKSLFFIITAALLLCPTSCRRPLEIMVEGLSLILENDYTLPYEPAASIPQLYRVNMYDRQSGHLVYRDYVPEKGGRIRFLPGDYLFYVYGYEDDILTVENDDDIKSLHVTAPPAGDEAAGALAECRRQTDGSVSTEPLICVNGCLWDGTETIFIPVLTETDAEYSLTVRNSAALKQGRITLLGIKGIGNIVSTECFVTNLAAGINPITASVDEASVTETFPLKVQNDSVSASFFFFGRTARQKEQGQKLYIQIKDRYGEYHYFSFDLKDIEPEGDMIYTIELDVDLTGKSGEECYLDVDEWGDETKDIPMKI